MSKSLCLCYKINNVPQTQIVVGRLAPVFRLLFEQSWFREPNLERDCFGRESWLHYLLGGCYKVTFPFSFFIYEMEIMIITIMPVV
jgi:hypothetical protein